MRKVFEMIAVLTCVGIISGAILASTYKYANPLILENQKKEEVEDGIFKIFPEAKNYESKQVGEDIVFKMKDKDGRLLGYAFSAEGSGYQGTIKIMAGIEPDLETIVGIKILESQETPGMGQEITQDKFKIQFKGLKTSPEITYVKNKKPEKPNEIEAVTGATVSSSAVVDILNKTIKTIKEYLQGGANLSSEAERESNLAKEKVVGSSEVE